MLGNQEKKKRTRMGNEGEIRMDSIGDTPSEEAGYDQRGHERKESGNDIEKESTLHTNSL